MTYKAKTTIHHGVSDTVHIFEPGDELPVHLFTKENLKGLIEAGAVTGDAEGYPEGEEVDSDDDDDKSDEDNEEDVDEDDLNDADKDELKDLVEP